MEWKTSRQHSSQSRASLRYARYSLPYMHCIILFEAENFNLVFCNEITWLIQGTVSALHESSKNSNRHPPPLPWKEPVPIMVVAQVSTTMPAGNVDTVEDGPGATPSYQAWLIMFTLNFVHTTWWCSDQKLVFKKKLLIDCSAMRFMDDVFYCPLPWSHSSCVGSA